MKRRALVLGGVAPHISLIERLKARGYEVLLVDYLESPPAKPYANKVFRESTLDEEAVYRIAQQNDVEVVMGVCVDHANVVMCKVAERLSLPHPYSLRSAQLATDKGLMKAQMLKHGIPTSAYHTVRTLDEVPWGELAYPLVVKPADNNGSKGVKRVEDDDGLRAGLCEALALSRSGSAIIEGFNEGREIQVDCFANEGVAHVLTIREKLKIPSANGMAMQVYGSVMPPDISEALAKEYAEIAQGIADAFGFEHTPFFFQTITDGTQINVLELSPRIGGGLSYKLIKAKTGVDVIDLAIDSYFGNRAAFELEPASTVMASTIVYARDGRLARVTGIDQMEAEGTCRGWDQMAAVGTEFGGHMDSRNRVGAYYSVAASHEQLRAMARRAEDVVDVLDEQGNSIKVRDLYYR